MAKLTISDLQLQIEALQAQLAALTGRPAAVSEDPKERTDYVEHGSAQHAAMLGLRKATEQDGLLAIDGWSLEDVTQYGPSANDQYLLRTLQQKVNELTTPIPASQSLDPRAPNFAPAMWVPGRRLADITE